MQLGKLSSCVVVLLLVGCSSMLSPVSQRATTYYDIVDASVIKADRLDCSKENQAGVLYIAPMRAYLPYDTSKMFYTQAKYELKTYSYSQWVALPTELLGQNLTKRIALSCTFKEIATSHALADAKYNLVTILVGLRQEINGDKASVHLIIASELVSLENNQLIATNLFNQQVETPVGPSGLVVGISQLSSQYNDQIVSWLNKNINALVKPSS